MKLDRARISRLPLPSLVVGQAALAVDTFPLDEEKLGFSNNVY